MIVFATALLSPGYLAAHALNLFNFRTRTSAEKLAWSIALSFGVGTIPIVALVWILGVTVTGYILLAFTILALILFIRTRQAFSLDRPILLTALAFIALIILSLVDIGTPGHLWMSVTAYDHGIRTAFIDAVLHTGVPPANPLYWPGHAAPMRYYYFWYVTCAVVAKLAHISARQALIASCLWPIAGVLATLALYARHLLGWQGTRLRRAWWITVALLSVTGLDLLATIGSQAAGDKLYADMEWWSFDQVSSWADSFLWVPHHVAALICCLLTLLLIWLATQPGTTLPGATPKRLQLVTMAGLSFAGAFGLSTYVALATAIILAVWFLAHLFHSDRKLVSIAVITAALTASVLLLPYLAQLLHHDTGQPSTSHSIVAFSVREIISPAPLRDSFPIKYLNLRFPLVANRIAASILLLPGYFAEFGFFFVALLLFQYSKNHRRQRTPPESTLLLWTWTGLAAATFLRSHVIATNDYGIRSMLLTQFFSLLIGAAVYANSAGWVRKFLLSLALIGVAGTNYQLVLLRVFLPWHELHQEPSAIDLSARNYALRDAYTAVDQTLPGSARFQYNPAPGGYFVAAQLLDIHHQVIIDDTACNASFGGDPTACIPIQKAVATLYAAPGISAADAASICTRIDTDYLVATRWDKVWSSSQSWVWKSSVTLDWPSVRILRCAAP